MASPRSPSSPARLALTGAVLAAAGLAAAVAGAAGVGGTRATAAVVQVQSRPADQPTAERLRRMNAIQNWGYWLSSFAVEGVIAAPHDLLVIDNGVSANRRFQRERGADEMTRMKRRPDGSPRVLLSYLSIGEAERYRPYWQQDWYDPAKKPSWLFQENPHWPGNYSVAYWDPDWQRLLFGAPEAYLDRILRQGFDGIYLDRADAFLNWEGARPSAREEMATLITRLAEYARRVDPRFLVVMQNAEELLDNDELIAAVDGVAKEDLLFGIDKPETPNKDRDVKWSLKYLHKAQKAGRKVLVVEYLSNPPKMAQAARRILDESFVPYFAPRLLNCLNPPAILNEAGRLPEHPCR
jgi:cysteinyl-tRNA synthetase, unknown class